MCYVTLTYTPLLFCLNNQPQSFATPLHHKPLLNLFVSKNKEKRNNKHFSIDTAVFFSFYSYYFFHILRYLKRSVYIHLYRKKEVLSCTFYKTIKEIMHQCPHSSHISSSKHAVSYVKNLFLCLTNVQNIQLYKASTLGLLIKYTFRTFYLNIFRTLF